VSCQAINTGMSIRGALAPGDTCPPPGDLEAVALGSS